MAGRIEIGNFSMSWGSRKDVGPTYDLKGTEAWSKLLGETDNFSEERVSERRAHKLATCYTCINVRARTIASLPVNVILEENGQKRILTDHSAYYPLAHEPNKYMSSANMFLTSMIHSDSWGNSLIFIHRDSRLRPYAFEIVKPEDWAVETAEGEAYYSLRGEMYPSRDVLHFRWFSYDGLCGISPIRLNAMTFGKAIKENRYSSTALGSRPPGMLTYEGNLTDPQRAQNQKAWKEDLAAGRTPVLGGKMHYQSFLIPPGDAEYIQTAQLTDQKIYGIFQLPPSFAQNYERMTWSNAENGDLVYAKHTVTNIVRVIEQECNLKLFTQKEKKNHYVKFNMNGLLRGDLAARAAFYTAMRNIGGINADEIRDKEDMNPYPGGDIFTIQGANVPVDQLREFYSSKVAPTAVPSPNGQKNGVHYEFN